MPRRPQVHLARALDTTGNLADRLDFGPHAGAAAAALAQDGGTTVELWVLYRSGGRYNVAVGRQNTGTALNGDWDIEWSATADPTDIMLWGNEGPAVWVGAFGSAQSITGKWVYTCWVLTGSSWQAYYRLDGGQLLPGGTGTQGALAKTTAGSSSLTIGANVGWGNGSDSQVALFRMWSRPLTQREIERLSLRHIDRGVGLRFVYDPAVDPLRELVYGVTGTPRGAATVRSAIGRFPWLEPLTRSFVVTAPLPGGNVYSVGVSSATAHAAALSRAQVLGRTPASAIAAHAAASRAQALGRAMTTSTPVVATTGRVYGALRAVSAGAAYTATLARAQVLARVVTVSVGHLATVARVQVLARTAIAAVAHTALVSGTKVTGSYVRALTASVAHTTILAYAQLLGRTATAVVGHTAVQVRGQVLVRGGAWSAGVGMAVTRVVLAVRGAVTVVAHAAVVERGGRFGRMLATGAALLARLLATLYRAVSKGRVDLFVGGQGSVDLSVRQTGTVAPVVGGQGSVDVDVE